ncbi:MAG: PDZ domain-containing protein [SAR202 cluster bacterium]|nr:trypsin [Chloroflexota bacterium]MDP7232384.1 trypsin-like peptidase domain-containing protein [Dehalococcoidia bacterium]MDP7613346.1 trypsin-like peptidase domain-containing protein [Dehalococcoidia bacterium]MQG46784.1 PDZ domain-containing protein [SAR202 cluster bacterium]
MRIFFIVIVMFLMTLSMVSCSIKSPKILDSTTQNSKTKTETNLASDSSIELLKNWESHINNVYKTVIPSVVQIEVNSFRTNAGYGTGFIWDRDGHIVTNFHVVQNAQDITVTFADGYEYEAEVIASDIDADLALLTFTELVPNLKPVSVGNSSAIYPGQFTIALGNPFGEAFTMTTGIVSAVDRLIATGFTDYKIPAVIQTDAAINPGNSGGPLVNIQGEVIGINTQIKSGIRQNSGVGFAVPIDLVKKVVTSLINTGTHEYAFLGISGVDLDRSIKEKGELPSDLLGVIVLKVDENSPSKIAGINEDSNIGFGNPLAYDGDVITAVDDKSIKSMEELINYLALYKTPGTTTDLTVFRDAQEISVEIELGYRPKQTKRY